MIKNILVALMLVSTVLLAGCTSDAEYSTLKKENQDLKTRLAQYEPVGNTTSNSSQQGEKPFDTPPVSLQSMDFDKSGVTGVKVVFQNTSNKTVDAIEFVILEFDNFGRPAYRFNDKSEGNVSGKLLMQEKAQPGGTMNSSWTLFNTDNTVKGKVVVKQVHFTDDTVWTNSRYDEQVRKEQESYK